MVQLVKNLPAMQETECNARDLGSIPGSGRSHGEGNGNPLQYSWEISRTEEHEGPQSMGLQRVGHDLPTKPPLCVYVNTKLLIYPSPSPFPFGNLKFVFKVCESVSVL